MSVKNTQRLVLNVFWWGVEFVTSWLLFLVTLDTSYNIWSNNTISMMMLRMLNHTHTYNYWYSLQIWLSQYWLHYYWLSHYWLRYYWFSHYLLRQYLLWQLLFLITFIVLLILSQPITCGYDNDLASLYDNYISLLEIGRINSYFLFMNGFCYSYSCQAEVWTTMLEEMKWFIC